MKMLAINPELNSINKFIGYLLVRLDWKFVFNVYGNIIIWTLLFFGVTVHRFGFKFEYFIASLLITVLPIFVFFGYWTYFFFKNRNILYLFASDHFSERSNKIPYSEIRIIEHGGDTNFCLTTFSFPFDYKIVGYTLNEYEQIVRIIQQSRATPDIRYKKGFK